MFFFFDAGLFSSFIYLATLVWLKNTDSDTREESKYFFASKIYLVSCYI